MLNNLNWSRSTLDLIWWWAKGIRNSNNYESPCSDTFRYFSTRRRQGEDLAGRGRTRKCLQNGDALRETSSRTPGTRRTLLNLDGTSSPVDSSEVQRMVGEAQDDSGAAVLRSGDRDGGAPDFLRSHAKTCVALCACWTRVAYIAQ